MTFSYKRMVLGGDWMNLVWVGVGIKKARGGSCVWKNACLILFLAVQKGQGQWLRDWVR